MGLPIASSMPQDVEVTSYLGYLYPKDQLMAWVFFGVVSGRSIQSQNFGNECWNVWDCFRVVQDCV